MALRTGNVSQDLNSKLIHGNVFASVSQAANRSRDLRSKIAQTGEMGDQSMG